MTELLLVLVSTVLVNNFVLVKYLGLCPFLGVSKQLESAIAMAVATALVLTLSTVSSHLLYHWVLVPLELEFLRILGFVVLIAIVVQITELVIHRSYPLLYRTLGIFVPLMASNCAVLGVSLLNIQNSHSLLYSAWYGFGTACGFGLVLILFAAMRERIADSAVPIPFRGPAIGLISAGLMALAFMGFMGLAKP